MKSTIIALILSASTLGMAVADDGVPNSAEIVKNAKWDGMQTVTVELSEHDFSPKELKLSADKPYRLVIKNVGEKDHYYTASEFFKTVAWRKAQTPRPHGGEIKAPYFTAVEAYKNGGTVELFLVPVKKGIFDVICTIDDHKDKGMFGKIIVE